MVSTKEILSLKNGELDELKSAEVMQGLINNGMAWTLEDHFGRQATDAIEDGRCMLGITTAFDRHGNLVPSRSQIPEGSKGSLMFVAKKFGPEYADMIAAIE